MYRSQSESGLWLRWSFALTFLRPDAVDEASILLFPNSPAEIQQYCDYLFENYISENAQFPPQLCAAFDLTTERTTNAVESFHNSYNQKFSLAHPHIYALMSVLREIREEVTIYVRSFQKGSSKNLCNATAEVCETRIVHATL